MKIAIITGASSGLGRAYIDAIIKMYPQINEIWLVARRKERLQEITEQYPKDKCKAIGLDLSNMESIQIMKELLAQSKPDIKLLVSNSGVAYGGDFKDVDLMRQMDMVDLNVRGAMAITHICLPYMRKGSHIIETCSVSAFAPTPKQIVYSATKECLLFFCKGLREELKPYGINVCALCPGNMATEMNVKEVKIESKSASGKMPFLDINKVAEKSLKSVKKGKAVCTPGIVYKGYRLLAKIFPHNLIMKFSKMG